MTRFARAKGSTSSNERKPEEATSWSEMKNAMLSKKESKPEEKESPDKEAVKDDEEPKIIWASLGGSTCRDSVSVIKKHFSLRANILPKEAKKVKKKKLRNSQTDVPAEGKLKSGKAAKKSKIVADEDESEVKIIKMEKESEGKRKTEEEEPEVKIKKKKGKKRELAETDEEDDIQVVIPKKKKKLRKILSDSEESKIEEIEEIEEIKEIKSKKSDRNNDNKKFTKDKDVKMKHMKNDESRNFSPKMQGKQKGEKKFKNKNFQEKKPFVEEIIINGEKIPITKFQGFYVTVEDAERLKKLRTEMIKQGIPKAKLESAMKLERRRAEKALSRLKKSVCFHCRGHGHLLSNCPELLEKEDTGTGICYKCGSTEHSSVECKVVRESNYQFAECFICKEQGHIARQCPDNPRGLYPQGGACRECGDVTHLRKDCPEIQAQKAEEVVTVGVRSDRDLECLDEEIASREKKNLKKKKKKNSTVKF